MNRFRLILTLAAALCAVVPVASHAEIVERGRFIDVENHRGGNVLQMVQLRERLARSGKTVRIRGYCRSACTILTTLPNACLGGGARIGFHAPRIPNTQIIPPLVDQIMGNYYRGAIRDRWFGGWNRSLDMQIITARQYVRMDPQARICGPARQGSLAQPPAGREDPADRRAADHDHQADRDQRHADRNVRNAKERPAKARDEVKDRIELGDPFPEWRQHVRRIERAAQKHQGRDDHQGNDLQLLEGLRP
jgi:hypothetical protein